MRRYYLHQRKGVYYAEIVTPEGHKLTARSTGKATKDEALLVVSRWLADGIPGKGEKTRSVETVIGLAGILKAIGKTDLDENDAMRIIAALKQKELVEVSVVKKGSGAKLFTDFLEEFWDYTSSPYVKERKAHGKGIGRRHCYEMMSRVHTYYTDYFEGRTLDSITWKDLKAFSIFLSEKREKPENYKGNFAEELSAAYRNKILIAGKTALKWAFNEEVITADPTARKISFAGASKKRKVLTPLQAALIFKFDWKDKRAYAGNLLALTTGCRAGEVLALRKSDIGEKVLHIRHSFSTFDGLKAPKNGEARKVPLFPEVQSCLKELLDENPHKEVADPFIFYGILPDKPMDQKLLIDGLKTAIKSAGIAEEAGGVVFHSWRHYYAARMLDKMSAEQITRISGHKTKAVFEEYADHIIEENLEEVRKVGAEVFGNILQFRKGA